MVNFQAVPEWAQNKSIIEENLSFIHNCINECITEQLYTDIQNRRKKFIEQLATDGITDTLVSTHLHPVAWIFKREIENVLFCYDYLLNCVSTEQQEIDETWGNYSSKYDIKSLKDYIRADKSIDRLFNNIMGIDI